MGQTIQFKKEKSNKEQIIFMPGLYDETMKLLVQSKNYFSLYCDEDQRHMSPLQRLIYSSVMTKITLRLSTVMSWVLAKRAYQAGQISKDELDAHFRLASEPSCMEASTYFAHFLPSFVQKLCNDSLALYSRIHKLDKMEHQAANAH